MNVLVLGVGSILMKDEGIGVRAVEELQARFRFPENVEILDGGTSGIELLSYLTGKDCLIILDAIQSGHSPGTVLRVEGDDIPARFRTRISPHQIGISDLLASAALTGEMPQRVVLFGIEPHEIKMELGLSAEAEAGMEKLIRVVVDELGQLGCTPEEKSDASAARSFWAES